MKKSNLLFLFSLCFFSLQLTELSAQLSVGLKAGYVKAWEDYGDTPLPENAQIHVEGFQVSGMLYLELSKNISIGIEPGYVQRGAACRPGFINFNSDSKWLLNYIELPVIAEARFPIFKEKIILFGKLGSGISRAVYAMEEVIAPNQETLETTNLLTEGIRGFRKWDYGMYASAGFALKLGPNQLRLETSQYFGLRNTDPVNTSRNRSLQLNLGYLISL